MIKILKKFQIKWLFAVLAAVIGIALMIGDFGGYGSSIESQAEEKIRTLCEKVKGVGEATVALTFDESEICGVGIVCDGGDDPEVVNRLLSLISASCAVPTNRIYITGAEKDTSPSHKK